MTWPTSHSESFFLQVAKGLVYNQRLETRQGLNRAQGITIESVWPQGNVYAFPPAASTMTVSSSDVNDAAAGTGVRTVRVAGLDANLDEISEVVTLNGQTGVSTVQAFLRVNGFTALTAGSGGTAAGTIYLGTGAVTVGVPAVVYSVMPLGFNQAQQIAYTVPRNHKAYVVSISASAAQATAAKRTEVSIRVRPQGGSLFLRGGNIVVTGQAADPLFIIPRELASGVDCDVVAESTDADTVVCVNVQLLLVKLT